MNMPAVAPIVVAKGIVYAGFLRVNVFAIVVPFPFLLEGVPPFAPIPTFDLAAASVLKPAYRLPVLEIAA